MKAVNKCSAVGLLLGIGLIVFPMSYACHGEASEAEIHDLDSAELAARGKQLRAAIQQKYQELISTKRLNGNETNITEAVMPYIPIRISFRDAETILRAGGFTLRYPDLNRATDPNRNKDWWYAVMAEISQFAQGLLFRVDAYVLLLPKSPGDYTAVEKVSASFLATSP
jgi:hypothetical protein